MGGGNEWDPKEMINRDEQRKHRFVGYYSDIYIYIYIYILKKRKREIGRKKGEYGTYLPDR